MLLSPIQNTAKLRTDWIQVRPTITQGFGENPAMYKPFGMKGHNGIDFGDRGDDRIFAPMSGHVKLKDSGKSGYGLHIKMRDSKKEVVLGHLREVFVNDGQYVNVGDKIGLMGNTGFSTAKHLHFGLRYLIPSDGDRWSWQVQDYNNGYFGYVDPSPFLITWKGTFFETSLT